MELNLKNYKSVLSKNLLKQAEKDAARECDETERGHFVAYVDEGNESYDVSLVISSKGEITAHACDCKSGNNFCRHRAALLLHIVGAKKIKQPLKAKKAVNKAEELLDEAEINDLREWVRKLLLENKDLELAFTHYFSAKTHVYTSEEVKQITNDAVKAVIRNKKNIDLTELKRIISLWQNMHTPVAEAYHANVSDKNLFLNFHAMIESYVGVSKRINFPGNKISKYIEDLLQHNIESINILYDDEAWEKAAGYFIQYLPDGLNEIRMYYLFHLRNLISVSNEERRKKLIDALVTQYSKSFPESIINGDVYTRTIFNLVDEYKLSGKYYAVFKPVRFANEYNKRLVEVLIEKGKLALAEKYCDEQVKGNYKEEYNIPYLVMLKEIYRQTKNEVKLSETLAQLFPSTFDFEDYLYIAERMPEEERKKWRTKILSKARNASNNRRPANEFVFRLMDHEKKYLKMIEHINDKTPYEIIYRYFESMVLTDNARLLKALLYKSDSYFFPYYSSTSKNDEEYLPALYTAMLKYYSKEYLKTAIKNLKKDSLYYHGNGLVKYIEKESMNEAI